MKSMNDLKQLVFNDGKLPYYAVRRQNNTTLHIIDKTGYQQYHLNRDGLTLISSKPFNEITDDDILFFDNNIKRLDVD